MPTDPRSTFADIHAKATAPLGGKASANAANEKTPKAELFSSKLKAIAPPRSGGSAQPGLPSDYGNPAKVMNPQDVKTLRQHSLAHDLLSKEGNLRTMAITNHFVKTGHFNVDAANRIHVDGGGKVSLSGTLAQRREAAGMLGLSSNKFLASAQELLGTGPGLALLGSQGVHHPIGTLESVGKGIGSSMAGTFTEGHYGSKTNTPLDDLMNLWTVASLGTGGAARVARAGSAESLGLAGKALVTRARQAPLTGTLGEGEHAQTLVAPASRNALAAHIQRRTFNRLVQHANTTGNVDLGGMLARKFGSSPTRVGRRVRAQLRVEGDIAKAPAAELARYGGSVTRRAFKGKKLGGLTMAQQHAAFIHSLAHTPETYGRASENAITHAEHLARTEFPGLFQKSSDPTLEAERVINRPKAIATIVRNHQDLLAKTKLASQYLDEHGNPTHPGVAAAVDAMKRAVSAREDIRGMTEGEIHHALGSRWYAINHLSENPTALGHHQELGQLEHELGAAKIPAPDERANVEAKLAENQRKVAELGPIRNRIEDVRNRLEHLRALGGGHLGDQHRHEYESLRHDLQILEKSPQMTAHPEGNEATYNRLLAEQASLKTRLHELGLFDRAEQIHGLFTRKGSEVHDRAFYLPTMSETKPLARGREMLTRRPGPYGFSAPQGERTHAFEGHLFNRGDYRTQSVPLAQHAFTKAQHLQAVQRLHEMLLSLSKARPEEVGHARPVPIRVNGTPTDELKRFVNGLYHGDVTKAEGASAKALWDHLLPAHVPEGEEVRYLHPDIASVFEPHQAGKMAKRLNRFNQLVRAQRYLNPRYGLWNVQNAGIGLPSQGAFMPANLLRYQRVIKKLDPETYSKIEAAVGAGMSKGLLVPGDVKFTQSLAHFWHHVNDHVYRMMQFVHEARVQGFHTAEDMKRLMNDPKQYAERNQIVERANKNAIDYGGMSPVEAASVRRALAYYPWTRGASLWTLRTLRDHPLFAQGSLEAGRRGKKYVDQFFENHGGMTPPSMEGEYPAHGGPIDMEALNPMSTLAQLGEAASGITNPHNYRYLNGSFLGQAAPAVKFGMDLLTGKDKFGNQPKSGSVVGQTLHDIAASLEPLQLLKAAAGHGRPKSDIGSSGFAAELERWGGWPQEKGVNYDNLAQFGASIYKGSLRGVAQEAADTAQHLRQVQQLAEKTKLPPGYETAFERYFSREGARNAQLTKIAWENGNRSDDYKKAITSLAFDHADLYLLATAETIARIYNRPALVGAVKKQIAQVNARKDANAAQKTTFFRTRADRWWDYVNPKTVKTGYYKMRDRANLN